VRCVLDTNVIVAGMRSPRGASAALLNAARRSTLTMLATVALALEYEAICRLPEHRIAAGFSVNDVDVFIDAVLAMIEPVGGRNCATRPTNSCSKPPSTDRRRRS
jgi:predicted nucleic acid-binding protein